MIVNLFILSHPQTDNYIFVRKEDAEHFVKTNMETWIQRKIDYRTFSIESAVLADKPLLITLKESRPELFL